MNTKTKTQRSRGYWIKVGIIGAVPVIAAAVAAFSLLRAEELPVDWSGKAEFCRTAQQFTIGNLAHGEADPLVLLKSLRQDAPPSLRSDLDVLIDATATPKGGEDRHETPSKRVGEFIETRCGVNLPGIVT